MNLILHAHHGMLQAPETKSPTWTQSLSGRQTLDFLLRGCRPKPSCAIGKHILNDAVLCDCKSSEAELMLLIATYHGFEITTESGRWCFLLSEDFDWPLDLVVPGDLLTCRGRRISCCGRLMYWIYLLHLAYNLTAFSNPWTNFYSTVDSSESVLLSFCESHNLWLLWPEESSLWF